MASEMIKYSFLDDYSEGAHPDILKALGSTNLVQQTAYGEDEYSLEAKALLRQHMGAANPSIFFVASGTLANLISISSCLRPHEAVIAADSGHIVLRETGAIEATGHKIITVPPAEGKLTPTSIQSALDSNSHFPHMAKPRLVYVSNATEVGTLYTKAELRAISDLCRENGLLFFMDGARLGAALAAEKNDATLADIAALTDMFWIGGTKVGALVGEAIVINQEALAVDFAFQLKQRGALLAKGRLLGLQFRELFRAKLFFDLASHANRMAKILSAGMIEAGHRLEAETETNQIFPILPNELIAKLQKSFGFYVWGTRDDGHSVVRLVTSWATHEDQVAAFIGKVGEFSS
jgi:threonine aldolase